MQCRFGRLPRRAAMMMMLLRPVFLTRRCFSALPNSIDHLKSEGDINLSDRRQEFTARHIGPETKALLEEDAKYFLHQTLSTPCLNALSKAEGLYVEDLEGRRYLDFHGNSVHQVGLGRCGHRELMRLTAKAPRA